MYCEWSGQTRDVIGLQRQTNASLQSQRLDIRVRQLQSPDAIENRVLLADDVLGRVSDGTSAQRLRAGAPIADRDRSVHLLADQSDRE